MYNLAIFLSFLCHLNILRVDDAITSHHRHNSTSYVEDYPKHLWHLIGRNSKTKKKMFEGENLSRRMKKVWKLITKEKQLSQCSRSTTTCSLADHCTALRTRIISYTFVFLHVFFLCFFIATFGCSRFFFVFLATRRLRHRADGIVRTSHLNENLIEPL